MQSETSNQLPTKNEIPMKVWYASNNKTYYDKLLEIDDSARKSGLSQNACSDALRKLSCIYSFCLRQADIDSVVEPKNKSSKPKYRKTANINFTVVGEGFNLDHYINNILNSNKTTCEVHEGTLSSFDKKRYFLIVSSTNKADLVGVVTKFVASIYEDTAVQHEDICVDLDLPSENMDNIVYVSKLERLKSNILPTSNIEEIEAYIDVDSDTAVDELEALYYHAYAYHLKQLSKKDLTSYKKIIKIHYTGHSSTIESNSDFMLNPQAATITDNLNTLNSRINNILNFVYNKIYPGSIFSMNEYFEIMMGKDDTMYITNK